MNILLEKAIKRLEELPKKLQNVYASMIFDELESEIRWDRLFEKGVAFLGLFRRRPRL